MCLNGHAKYEIGATVTDVTKLGIFAGWGFYEGVGVPASLPVDNR